MKKQEFFQIIGGLLIVMLIGLALLSVVISVEIKQTEVKRRCSLECKAINLGVDFGTQYYECCEECYNWRMR